MEDRAAAPPIPISQEINYQENVGDSEKTIIQNEMKKLSLAILKKHLEGRTVIQEKVKKWSDFVIDEVYSVLSKKYPQFGYLIFFFMSDITAFVANANAVYYPKTDIHFNVPFHTNNFYSAVRVYATKKTSKTKNFLENMNDSDMVTKINYKITSLLEDRQFVFEPFQNVVANICQDINEVLLERDDKPCSYHTAYINRLPTNGLCFYYKCFDMEFNTINFIYSNASFICRVFLFFINN